ncbi:DNA gyrase subunit A [Tetragenococcus muriaticus PMC-11-5]|nr:DNA gyrase subunit A [Tetragenococcus muriaticus PMC-11-5]
MVITDKGVIIRFRVEDISQTGRSTLGVRLMKMEEDAKVVTMATVDSEELEKLEEPTKE